jgi:hypothetical protein
MVGPTWQVCLLAELLPPWPEIPNGTHGFRGGCCYPSSHIIGTLTAVTRSPHPLLRMPSPVRMRRVLGSELGRHRNTIDSRGGRVPVPAVGGALLHPRLPWRHHWAGIDARALGASFLDHLAGGRESDAGFLAAVARFAVAVVLCVAKPGKELPLEFAYSPSTQIDRLKAGWGAGAQDRGCRPWPPPWGVAVMPSVDRG